MKQITFKASFDSRESIEDELEFGDMLKEKVDYIEEVIGLDIEGIISVAIGELYKRVQKDGELTISA